MPELDDLMEDVRATAPKPRDAFLETMERRVEAGFPRQRRPRFPALRALAPALATLLILAGVIAPVALLSNSSGGDDDSGSAGEAGGGAAVQQDRDTLKSGDREESSEAADGGAAYSVPEATSAPAPRIPSTARLAPGDDAAGGADQAPGRARRLVEQRHTLTVETPSDEFDETTAEVLNVADSTGTIVQTSNVSEREGRGRATFDLRVPSSRVDDVLRELSGLGKVTERRAAREDITGVYVSAQNRLEDARDTRRALLEALERADTPAEADALRARIADARRRIAAAERDIRRTRARADRSRVALTVESSGKISEEGSTWTPGDAAGDALRVLEVAVGVALIALAVAAPFAILALLLLASTRLLRRRAREAALG
jgi:hypothetical protein